MPWPVPIHILVTRIFFFCLLASARPVTICLAPVAPRGCPKAMAPPLGLTFSASSPNSLIQYTAIEAKASLISKRSISSLLNLNFPSSFGIATDGPIPMILGARPWTVAPQNFAIIVCPILSAVERFMSSTDAAPSVTCEEFPPVLRSPH